MLRFQPGAPEKYMRSFEASCLRFGCLTFRVVVNLVHGLSRCIRAVQKIPDVFFSDAANFGRGFGYCREHIVDAFPFLERSVLRSGEGV